ncbi:SDR family oxidoreductase [Acinetobacter vivianii]|uniref:SDR family oxidoreductase n=1 Tax=Acinetobacter vivianii TaxID=1776742 RepID=UPI002DB5F6E2|nr:NAD(P)-dependent oxidoreductase [Acinetobacter vivianii]MEB6479241.1 NAD(P)-dependent oxidoreductase [Acinetobacter vivianii]MEB6656928.1 NAD(P)-dependent oxidoreductase [Acinetobacter vivianii]
MNNMHGKTIFITGGSRGIGRAIAIKAAHAGANVVIAAKTEIETAKLTGTIYSVAQEIEAVGGKALPLLLDVRDEQQIHAAIQQAVQHFGGIDVLINNAGAIALTGVEATSLKQYDLIQSINHRATFICAQAALPFLKQAEHPHILSLSPPVNMSPKWLGMLSPYALSKYGMTILTLGMAEEFHQYGISCNTLWPETYIATAAVSKNLGEENTQQLSRKPEIMADAAFAIYSTAKGELTGQSLTDEQALARIGITDFAQYACIAGNRQLQKDFFLD